MEYLTLENWELIRSVLGVLICLVSVLYIIKSKPDFNKTLGKELSNKNLKKIKKQVKRLKEENYRTKQLLAKIHHVAPLINGNVKRDNKRNNSKPKETNTAKTSVDQTMSFINMKAQHNQKYKNPYEQVRFLVASGMNKEEIYETMDIPGAEIDLMLKFNQLAKSSQAKEKPNMQIQAYG